MTQQYQKFIESKKYLFTPAGFTMDDSIVPDSVCRMFQFQHDIVRWACALGKAAVFADCGLGKTLMQLQWAWQVSRNEGGGQVLIVAPLAVSRQTAREAEKFGIPAVVSRDGQAHGSITITNYEQLQKFNPADFVGVVLDESSILKSMDGKTRNMLIDMFRMTPFKLACTATPAPNDYMELGNHAEFLGVMTRENMLSKFFYHDSGETSKWTLKGHAEDAFWEWAASWSVMLRTPGDISYDSKGYDLPELSIEPVTIPFRGRIGTGFIPIMRGLQDQQKVRRESMMDRVQKAAELVAQMDGPVIVWCELNDEGDALEKAITGSVQVKGSTPDDRKEELLVGFSNGDYRVLVTKPSIAGFGLNWQHCHNMVFTSVTYSFEMFYQAVRRCWRFGQEHPVRCCMVYTDAEATVFHTLDMKRKAAASMQDRMMQYVSLHSQLKTTTHEEDIYMQDITEGKAYRALLGDTCEKILDIPDSTIGYSIFSPPFASLYTYSNSARDLGNCDSDEQFIEHFRFIVKEMLRITAPGRLCSFHCMNLPTSKVRDGFIGIKDFRGELIRLFQECGWIYHSEVVIWKDPVVAMQRTKALGLLHKQVMKDSAMSRQGIPDYLVTMRKPGENPEPVEGRLDEFVGENPPSMSSDPTRTSIDIWQRYASPVWMDINQSRTLNKEGAREEKDEKHICPLQLDVIERGIQLWSNPGDTVFSPFMGIGSEGYCAVKMGRKFIGCELKKSYYDQALLNLKAAEAEAGRPKFFEIDRQ